MRRSLKTSLTIGFGTAVICAGIVTASGSASRTETTPPRYTSPPSIVGIQVGQTLTANPGVWSGTAPITFEYQWIRSGGTDGTPIPGATSQTYTPTKDDIGHDLFVQVKATNSAGWFWGNSVWSGRVTGPTQSGAVALPDGRTSVPVENVVLPNRLVLTAATFAPATLKPSGTVVAKVSVEDAQGNAVSGAMVLVTALPFGSIAPQQEVATDATGVATITLKGQAQLAQTPGGAIGLSIRASKPGDDVLKGVTATRLFKLPISH